MNDIEQNRRLFFKHVFNKDPAEGELERAMNLFGYLNDREQNVLTLRFGLDGSKPRTLLEASREMKPLTRERIRQIETIAISKILHAASFPEEIAIIPVPTQGKWVLTQDGQTAEFASFEDAVNEFRHRIQKHMQDYEECYFDGLPFEVGAFFAAREDNEITDEEIAVSHRLSKLTSCLTFSSIASSTATALEALNPKKRSVSYSGVDIYSDDILAVDIQEENQAVKVRIEYGESDDTRYLISNAFSFANRDIDYYFDSHQVVICGAEQRLGLEANLRLNLRRVG